MKQVCCDQCTHTISQTSYHTPHWLCQPFWLYCVFMLTVTHCFLSFLFSCFFLFSSFPLFFKIYISVRCCLLQKWGLVNIAVSDVASCLAVVVCLYLHAFSCLLASVSFWPRFISPFWFCSVPFFSCHFWGSQSWGCLSCLSVTGRYTCKPLRLTVLLNLVQHIHEIIHLLQSGHYTWPYLSLSLYHDNFLRWQSSSELNLWVWNIIIHFAVLKGFAEILSQSHIIVPSSF